MGKYNKEYEAFEIFEQIQNEKSREETVQQPLPQGRVREILSFEEAPYYEFAYDTEPVQDGVTAAVPEAFALPGDRAGAEEERRTGAKEEKRAEAEVWSQTEAEEWSRAAAGVWVHRETEEIGVETRSQTEVEVQNPTAVEAWVHRETEEAGAESRNQGQAAEVPYQAALTQTRSPSGWQQAGPEKIGIREEDPVREQFNRMRDIAREDRYLNFRSSHFYNQKMQQENARLFYRQGMLMKDFRDAYAVTVPYASYYPSYQMMGYEQLRTFFTWRTQVREGRVEHVSLSYAFLYIYELLNNIGVENPGEGLERLLFFWDAFRVYDRSVDKYVVRWLKDYYIYYGLPGSFRDFVEENSLGGYYPELSGEENAFELFCGRSKYDIRKSAFYAGREEQVRRCFLFTLERLREALAAAGFELDRFLFQPTRKMAPWVPFLGALFCPAGKQADRQVMLSRKEIYVCSRNQWTFSALVTTDSGKRLMGYCLKQMESLLRKMTRYRHKLTANPDMISSVTAEELKQAGICLETVIAEAVTAFYREETKTVVQVNRGALEKIRKEAYVIQEKLTVPEDGGMVPGQTRTGTEAVHAAHEGISAGDGTADKTNPAEGQERIREAEKNQESVQGLAYNQSVDGSRKQDSREKEPDTNQNLQDARNDRAFQSMALPEITEQFRTANMEGNEGNGTLPESGGEWDVLRERLTDTERQALDIILYEKANLKEFAHQQGIMLEVLAEGINEKAADVVGDGILDNEFAFYEDYLEEVRKMLDVT